MPYINLIQEQRSHSQREEVRARAGFFAFVGVAVLMGAGYAVLFTKSAALDSQEAGLKARLQALAPDVAQIQANRAKEAELRPKLTSLEEAQGLTQKWIGILSHFKTQMPQNTWLTGLRSNGAEPDKPVAMTINGLSVAQEPIGEFIMRTQNEPDLDAVALRFTNERTSMFGNTIEFEIGAEIKGTAPEKLKEDEEVKQ
jgi:Tfp pilus assembly protein PilN